MYDSLCLYSHEHSVEQNFLFFSISFPQFKHSILIAFFAEEAGFEPTARFQRTVLFKSTGINHSPTPPNLRETFFFEATMTLY